MLIRLKTEYRRSQGGGSRSRLRPHVECQIGDEPRKAFPSISARNAYLGAVERNAKARGEQVEYVHES
jgi:hypothetical protein